LIVEESSIGNKGHKIEKNDTKNWLGRAKGNQMLEMWKKISTISNSLLFI
jgi:hypothetical protein